MAASGHANPDHHAVSVNHGDAVIGAALILMTAQRRKRSLTTLTSPCTEQRRKIGPRLSFQSLPQITRGKSLRHLARPPYCVQCPLWV